MMDVLHMFHNSQGHVLHMFYNFQNDSKNNFNTGNMATFKTVALRQRADGFWNVSIRVTYTHTKMTDNDYELLEMLADREHITE